MGNAAGLMQGIPMDVARDPEHDLCRGFRQFADLGGLAIGRGLGGLLEIVVADIRLAGDRQMAEKNAGPSAVAERPGEPIEIAGSRKIVTITVSRTWKGTKGKTVKVRTAISGASCGYGFQKGKSYLVYCYKTPKAAKEAGILKTNICTRTKLLAKAKGDLTEIGEGKTP